MLYRISYGMEQRLSGCSLPEWHHLQSSRWLHFKDKRRETPPPVQQEAEITLVHICNKLASGNSLASSSSLLCWSISIPFQKNQTLELVKRTRPTRAATYGRSLGAYQPLTSDHLVCCHGNPRFQPISASPEVLSPLGCYPSRPRQRCVLMPSLSLWLFTPQKLMDWHLRQVGATSLHLRTGD